MAREQNPKSRFRCCGNPEGDKEALRGHLKMQIKSRKVSGKYVEIKIVIGESTHDLGFHDKKEAEQFARELLTASLDIQSDAEGIN